MKCIHCGKEAMMEIRLIPLDGKEEEIYLCRECMEKYFSGQGMDSSEEFSFFQEVLEKLLGSLLTEVKENKEGSSREEEPWGKTFLSTKQSIGIMTLSLYGILMEYFF